MSVTLRSIADAPNLAGVTVLVRASLNVPVVNGVIQNEYRVEQALPTIAVLSAAGARIVLLSHRNGEGLPSMRPVYDALKSRIPMQFVDDVCGPQARSAAASLKNGQVLMVENLRRDRGEEANDEAFARSLASLGNVFVNDDFATAHRSHASIVRLPNLMPSYAGLQFMKEVSGLTPALVPSAPSLAIIGGAKFLTKEPFIRSLLAHYSHVFIGGALANDFLRARGWPVGRSLVSNATIDSSVLNHPNIILPVDVTVRGPDGDRTCIAGEVRETDIIYDAGPATLGFLQPLITAAKTLVWNGPLGNFELGYRGMTETLATIIARAPGVSIVGGGDTTASIEKLGLNKKFEFVSTAGGAMLDFLTRGTLPGIAALEQSHPLE